MMTTMDIVDADQLAAMAGVSRRTVRRASQRVGAEIVLGNKAFVLREKLREVMGRRYDQDMENIPPPVRGKHEIEDGITLQEAADALDCSRSTVLRIVNELGLGVQLAGGIGRRYISKKSLPAIKAAILPHGVTARSAALKEERKRARRTARNRSAGRK